MKKDESGVLILSETKNGERIVSCGGRISTRPGSAIELYRKATDKEKNLSLVSKVVASGHKTVLEHHYFNLAFNNVSIFIEQFLIEFRLAAFTIKSGRYVNFSKAGFNLSTSFSSSQQQKIKEHFTHAKKIYDKFVKANIPVEDARFVLPYGLKTNIYMSVNARELIHIICTMIYGRGKEYEEIYALGKQLKDQLDKRYPGLVDANAKNYLVDNTQILDTKLKPCKKIEYVTHKVTLLSGAQNALKTLDMITKTANYTHFDFKNALKNDKMAKNLEHFNYTFKVENFTLIILKHYTRHRMQSLSTSPLVKMAQSCKFVIPPTIQACPELKADFEKIIKENRELYNQLLSENINPYLLVYIMPHATAIDFISTLNARELLHLFNLRTCNRAQWVIRYMTTDMLRELRKLDPEMFKFYGPSCYTYGVCPEGRLCCGKQAEVKKQFDNL